MGFIFMRGIFRDEGNIAKTRKIHHVKISTLTVLQSSYFALEEETNADVHVVNETRFEDDNRMSKYLSSNAKRPPTFAYDLDI